MALAPGTRLGVYEVIAPIGEGGMGQVYRATDTTLVTRSLACITPNDGPVGVWVCVAAPLILIGAVVVASALPLAGR